MIAPAGRRGFTLVELLVVTGLISSLLALVVTGLRSTGTAASQARQSAQALASALVATQSRALGSPNGAGLIIDPVGVQGLVATAAMMHPMITGSVTNGMPPSNPAVSSATITFEPDNADVGDLVHGYRILFGPAPASAADGLIRPDTAWFSYSPLATNSATVRFRTSSGQTPQNTIWPKQTASHASIARYPSPSGSVAVMDPLVAIDLRNSGVGNDPTTAFGQLHNRGAVAITFDQTGAVSEVMQNVLTNGARLVDPQSPKKPIYFLIASRADIENPNASTLSSSEVAWVTIFPQTGRVAVSSNIPQSGTNAAALEAARANATLGMPFGR